MKHKTKIFALGLVSSALIAGNAMAQTKVTVPNTGTPALTYFTYTNQELQSSGCDPNVWNELVADYIQKRTLERAQQGAIQVQDQAKPPIPAGGTTSGRSCFENATNQINSAISGINSLLSIFTGSVDWSSLANNTINQLTTAACNQIDAYLVNMTSGVLQPINNTVNQTNSTIGGASINTSLGSVNVGGAIVPNTSTTTTVPYVNTTTNTTGTIQNTTTEILSNIQQFNPFR